MTGNLISELTITPLSDDGQPLKDQEVRVVRDPLYCLPALADFYATRKGTAAMVELRAGDEMVRVLINSTGTMYFPHEVS